MDGFVLFPIPYWMPKFFVFYRHRKVINGIFFVVCVGGMLFVGGIFVGRWIDVSNLYIIQKNSTVLRNFQGRRVCFVLFSWEIRFSLCLHRSRICVVCAILFFKVTVLKCQDICFVIYIEFNLKEYLNVSSLKHCSL